MTSGVFSAQRGLTWAPLILGGWAALAVSVVIPLAVSVHSWLHTRDLRCFDRFEYTFAPLLVTCGGRSPATTALGWTLWGATVGGLVVAIAVALISVILVRRLPPNAPARFETWMLFAGVAAVALITLVVLSVPQGALGGNNAWVLYASGGSFLALVFIAILRPLARLAIRR